jgi:hypothetical protein
VIVITADAQKRLQKMTKENRKETEIRKKHVEWTCYIGNVVGEGFREIMPCQSLVEKIKKGRQKDGGKEIYGWVQYERYESREGEATWWFIYYG